MTLSELSRSVAEGFAKTYGRPATWVAAAPGRVNVIGEHTDYNDGFVLPMAIDRYTAIAAAPALKGEPTVRLRSTLTADPLVLDLSQPLNPLAKGSWGNYPLGVIAGFVARGMSPGGFDGFIESTVPLGSGLSSSAALEVSTATLLEAVLGRNLDPVEKALVCHQAEQDYAGLPCGIMDQFISALGREDHLLLLDCRSRRTELIPMRDPEVSILITNTNVKHELTGGEYAVRRAQCEEAAGVLGVGSLRDATPNQLELARGRLPEVPYRRARHVIGEIDRTLKAAERIQASDWKTAGELMYASHKSLRNDYEVSCAELDAVVEIAAAIGLEGGVFGCRMTGGGFGGCTVALVCSGAVPAVSQRLAEEYERRTGLRPTLFVSRPAAGARVVAV
jgi:galactokinase